MDTEILKAISNVGFPIFVTTFVLMRIEKELKRIRSMVDEIAVKVDVKIGKESEDE